jgi:hypothetical protein
MAALVVALTAPAAAQFKKAPPGVLSDYTPLECSVVQKTYGPDRDPVYKIDVDLTLEQGRLSEMLVKLTTQSGSTYVRSDQYSDQVSIWQTNGRMEWYWKGVHGWNTMVGEVWYNDSGWWYSEKLYDDYHNLKFQMTSRCHERRN